MMPAQEALLRASFKVRPEGDFHTMAGFALFAMGHLPALGERFDYEGWQFEIIDWMAAGSTRSWQSQSAPRHESIE